MNVKAGDWVCTHRHRHHGKVLAVYPDCPENELWQEAQKDLTDEQMTGQWALIFDPKEMSVLVPVSDCEPGEEIPLDQLPERIVIEAFGQTEEESRQIAEALDTLPGGDVRRLIRLLEGGIDE